ncbi:MAG: hypothetical protein ACQEUZ_11260 [Pseudomonadota bacterium]
MKMFGAMALGLAAAMSLSTAAQALVVTGQVELGDFDGDGDHQDFSIESFDFTVLSPGDVNFDVLAYEVAISDDLIGPSDTRNEIDTQILLYDRGAETQVFSNDDGLLGSDGSVSNLDSNTTAALGAGDYRIFVGSLSFTLAQALAGFREDAFLEANGFQEDEAGIDIPGSPGDFQLTISALDGEIAASSAAVPVPAALPMLAGGLAVAGLAMRRRRARAG